MRKSTMIGWTDAALFSWCLLLCTNLFAQHQRGSANSKAPWVCSFLDSSVDVISTEKDDPAVEQAYAMSSRDLYRVWCKSEVDSAQDRENAANTFTRRWKSLWYRDNPFNAAFHEVGSFDLLVLMGITHKVPKPMIDDPAFMSAWLEDCKDRCFMIYGDDDPGAKDQWLKMLRLRNDVLKNLKREPAAKPVLTMLKNAKLYPVR